MLRNEHSNPPRSILPQVGILNHAAKDNTRGTRTGVRMFLAYNNQLRNTGRFVFSRTVVLSVEISIPFLEF